MIHEGRILFPVRIDESGKQIIDGLPAGERPQEYVIEEATLELQKILGANIVAVKGPDDAACAKIMQEKSEWQDE